LAPVCILKRRTLMVVRWGVVEEFAFPMARTLSKTVVAL
jgi:hypothetical protein